MWAGSWQSVPGMRLLRPVGDQALKNGVDYCGQEAHQNWFDRVGTVRDVALMWEHKGCAYPTGAGDDLVNARPPPPQAISPTHPKRPKNFLRRKM